MDVDADSGSSRVSLACERCKRRKIKCDRILPSCGSCIKTSNSCLYPTFSQKPGPKPGAHQRRQPRILNTEIKQQYTPFISSRDSQPISNSSVRESAYIPRHGDIGRSLSQPYSPRVSVPSPTAEHSASRVAAISHLLNLSHDPVPSDDVPVAEPNSNTQRRGVDALCIELDISPDTYSTLLNSYFDNMTAFSLFHRPTFATKVLSITSPVQQRALIASMFAVSARFVGADQPQRSTQSGVALHEEFRIIAEEAIEMALKECHDESPSLCLLQALLLTTFQQLAYGVRGRSSRALYTSVSVAYDLHLHLVDRNALNRSLSQDERVLLEEKRRSWWTLWELDVFASTIRKVPTTIDWTVNQTWLPVEDEQWFNGASARSCTLNPDSAIAWKELEKSENQSSKAWFIVITALVRSSHMAAFSHEYPSHGHSQESLNTPDRVPGGQSNLDVLSNSLYCLSAALPERLSYNGEFLSFSFVSFQNDSAKYSIHVIMNLGRLMLHHPRVSSSTIRCLGVDTESSQQKGGLSPVDKAAWNVYLAGASEIVTVIRNSAPKHARYVSPFLTSTIRLAAAAQVVFQKVEPHNANKRVAESNLDVLLMSLDAYTSFWGVSSSLQQSLKLLVTRLETARVKLPGLEVHKAQENQLPIGTALGANLSQRVDGHFRNGAAAATQHHSAAQQSLDGSDSPAQDQASDAWTIVQPVGFNATMSAMGGDKLWEYDLDALLAYAGFE